MKTTDNYVSKCTQPEIVASRLISLRNIYLREELRTISNEIQKSYEERLPALQLVSLAAYEQVFNRQPLSLPEELRREAIKYGLKYYQLYIEKLRISEVHADRLTSSDKKHPSKRSQRSTSLKKKNNKYNSSDSTFSDTVSSSSSSTDISNDTISNLSSTDSVSKTLSNKSMTSTTTDQLSSSNHELHRTNSPQIIVHRSSDTSLTPNKRRGKRNRSLTLYMLEPWERALFSAFLFAIISTALYSAFVFLPHHVRSMIQFYS
ncbi:unnamed protein product [Adineta steineri]|uniref:Uncharacterized protein n=2 Tax=Adineta steineri TaxID=433720 RepID=A0A813SSM1_9BILA|nr:unnamed protein product [Adineta steineri]CAF3713131.1 unnamed protein product [Adineta steineri]